MRSAWRRSSATRPSRATILHAPTYNAPSYLTGRRSLMGYAGHLWSSGVNYFEREADIRRTAGESDAMDLLRRYDVDFIVVSPMERNQLAVNDGFLDQFPVFGRSGYTLYEVPKAQGNRRARARSRPPPTSTQAPSWRRRAPAAAVPPARPVAPDPTRTRSPIAGSGSGRSSSSSLPR